MPRPHASCLSISVACLSLRKTASPRPHLGVRLPWLVPIAAALVVTVTLSPSSLLTFMLTVSGLLSHFTNSLEHLLSCFASFPVSLLPWPCLASQLHWLALPHQKVLNSLALEKLSTKLHKIHEMLKCVQNWRQRWLPDKQNRSASCSLPLGPLSTLPFFSQCWSSGRVHNFKTHFCTLWATTSLHNCFSVLFSALCNKR